VRRLGPELQIAGTAAFWGSIGLVVRQIDLPAVVIVTFRVGIAAVGLAAFLAVRPDGRGRHLLLAHPARTLAQGAILAVHWVLFFAALQRAPVGTVVLVVFVSPVLVAALAPFVLHEAFTRRVGLALVLALGGSVLVLGPGADGVETIGLVYALLAALLLAALVLNAKVLTPVYGGLRLTLAQCTVAAVILVPFALLTGDPVPLRADVGWLVLLGLVHTALALVVYLSAFPRVPATHISVLSYLEPVSAAILGWLVLDETMTAGTIVGGLLVIAAGILVVAEAGEDELGATPEAAGVTG